jgi:hypothetical protein
MSERRAFTMLKHQCAALLIFTMLKHRCAAMLIFPKLKHHCSSLFISSHSQNTPVRHILIIFTTETTPSSTCFAFLPSVAETPLPATSHFLLSVAETPLPATFHHFFSMLKHHCSAFFIPSHSQNTPACHFLTIFIVETTPSSTCFDFLPFVAETPLSTTFHFFHPASAMKQFRPAIVSPLSVAETPLSATLHHSFTMLKHHCSA